MSVTMKKIATTKTIATPKKKSPPARLWVDTLRAFIVPNEWLTWSLSNLLTGMESCVSFARVLIQSFFGNLLADSWDWSDLSC